MLRPIVAATALAITLLINPASAKAAQEQGICQSEQVGCSSGPQSCAVVQMRYEILPYSYVWIPLYCWQTAS